MSSGFAADLLSLTDAPRTGSRKKPDTPASELGSSFAGILNTTRQMPAAEVPEDTAAEQHTESAGAGRMIAESAIAIDETATNSPPQPADTAETSPSPTEETEIATVEAAELVDDAGTEEDARLGIVAAAPKSMTEPQGVGTGDGAALPADAAARADVPAPAMANDAHPASAPAESDQRGSVKSAEAPDAGETVETAELRNLTDRASTTSSAPSDAEAVTAKPSDAKATGGERAEKTTDSAQPADPAQPPLVAEVKGAEAATTVPAAQPAAMSAVPATPAVPASPPKHAAEAVQPVSGKDAPIDTVDLRARPARTREGAHIPSADEFAKVLTGESGLDHSQGLEKSAGAAQAGLGHSASPLALATAPGLSGQPAGAAPQFNPNLAALSPPATMIAAPEELVDIFTTRLAGADKPDRITVQLDPPELGRVSIEFKFDAQGLQHVAVTSDTPEAMQRLRMMHSDLVQSLEQHGLNARDMSFSQNTPQRDQQMADAKVYSPFARQDDAEGSYAPQPVLASRQARTGSGGLNIKL